MKYVIILADGMADYPVEELSGKTPMEIADKPTMNLLAGFGEVGLVKTVPEGMAPGSDTANLSVMGYNPREYYTGRSPFEAISMGLTLAETDMTFRCNVVTLSEDEPYGEKVMLDHSSDEISTPEAAELIKTVNNHLKRDGIGFYPGVSYRHIMIWNHAPNEFVLIPPHDIIGRKIKEYLPGGPYGDVFLQMMKESSAFLKDHPINIERVRRGLRPANSIWLWGEGKSPALSSFYEKYRLKGSVISAVDLIKGIGLCAGLSSIDVEGVTGNVHTNFEGKARAALDELKKGQDFVYIHLEAPDEAGHRFEVSNKIKAIEAIDKRVLKLIYEELKDSGEDFKIMILPDHPTPLILRTHTGDPVPYLIYSSTDEKEKPEQKFNESSASKTGKYIEQGHLLMDHFIRGKFN